MAKKIFVIGGGIFQVPLCRKIKEMGYELVNSNLYENSPSFEYADYCFVSDVLDKEYNLKIAKELDVDAVLTDQTDIAVPTVAYIAEQLGLNGIGTEKAELFTNKSKMREFCESIGFSSPEYLVARSLEEAEAFLTQLDTPIVIKPLDSQASRGVKIINGIDELRENFNSTLSCSRNDAAVLCERYVNGREFTVDGYFINGVHHTLAISKKHHYKHNKSIASELFFATDDEQYDYDLLRKENDRLMNASGIPFGLTHCEYKIENGKYFLIEMAARGGGTYISSLIVPSLSGVDNYEILIKQALGEEIPQVVDSKGDYENMILKFLDPLAFTTEQNKVIKAIKGIEEVKKIPGIIHFELELSPGDHIQNAQDDRGRIGYYIAGGKSEKEISNIEQEVYRRLELVF